jgi:hypothetical protein
MGSGRKEVAAEVTLYLHMEMCPEPVIRIATIARRRASYTLKCGLTIYCVGRQGCMHRGVPARLAGPRKERACLLLHPRKRRFTPIEHPALH